MAQEPAERVAVVIGNSDYASIPDLPNAAGDADAIAALMRDFGYRVYAANNLDRRGFEDLIREVMLNVPDGADLVFFYAGHGIQLGSRNYLLPVDVAFTDVHDLPLYSVTLDRVIDALSARGAVHVAIIDACRQNPFPGLRLAADIDASLFETQSGFEPFRTPLNSLVAFSTAPGEVARDGDNGARSPYTAAILSTARADPGESVVTLLGEVREQVYNATGGAQIPWESSTLIAPFHFVDDDMLVQAEATTAPETETTGDVNRAVPEIAPEVERAEIAVEQTLQLDRFIRLDTILTDALGQALLDPTILSAPRFGEVAIASGGEIYYRPALQELRATDLADYTLDDTVKIETGPADARQSLALDLSLTANQCDLEAGDALDLGGVGLYRLPNEIDVAAALAACQAAVAAEPDVARFRYQLGRAERAAGDFVAATASFEAAVAAGHVRANNALAAILLSERIDRGVFDVPYDPARAATLLEEGIVAGDPYAIHTRGNDLLRNGTTPEQVERGYDLVDRAAELGHTYAMNTLGGWFLTADSDHFIPARGIAYYTVSARHDDIYGFQGLGTAALRGADGQEPDFQAAFGWFEKAALGGHPSAPASIGRMIMRGQLGDPDPTEALRWYDMGLARGDGWSGANGADVILAGGVTGMGSADAAVRAAKATLLPADDAALAARTLLAGLDDQTLGLALQTALADMGAAVTLDGAVGPATLGTLAQMQDAAGLGTDVPDDATDRLIAAARIYWARNPVRPDVF